MSPTSTSPTSTSPTGTAAAAPASAAPTPPSTVGADEAAVPVVGPRQPCPCGSGKRYKLCHGRRARAVASELVLRPFAGLAGEAEWVALREVLPAASAAVRTGAGSEAHGVAPGTAVEVVSVLPGAVAGLRRPDGTAVVALQTSVSSGDASRDVAAALLDVLALAPGSALDPAGLPGPGPRLQDLLDDASLEVTVHDGFGFWVAQDADLDPAARAELDEASAAIDPTAAVDGVVAAYWTRIAGRELLRWVFTQDEQELLDALGRLGAQREGALGLSLVPGSRFLGVFRALGLLVPVWDLPTGTGSDALGGADGPAAAFAARLEEALAATGPLDDAERRARAGVVSRQPTLR